MTQLRTQLFATTILVAFGASGAIAQEAAPSTPQPAAPSAPIEAQPLPSATTQAQPATKQADIIVTGTRIPQVNLTSAAPITVVSDQDIKLQGTTRIEDLLDTLPSVGAAQNGFQSNAATGTAEIDLRYLGSKRTLTLINGRRMTPGDPNNKTQAGDLNLIPASLVKRVDILTGGASSVYGADAVAGVVNFIIDTNFSGIRFDGETSFYQHNNNNPFVGDGLTMGDIAANKGFRLASGNVIDGGSFDGNVTIGGSFGDGKGHAVVYLGYRTVDPVLQAARDYSDCTIQNGGTGTPRCGGSGTASPGNAVVFVPNGHGGHTSTLAALGPGTIGLQPENIYNFAPLNYFQRKDERYIGGAFAHYDVSDAIKPYFEFMFMDDHSPGQVAPSGDFGQTLTINCNNPLLSAQQLSVICAPGNLINGSVGSFPTAVGASYNPTPGAAPIQFVDPTTGATYERGFLQVLRRNVEGGPRIADFKHLEYRGVLGVRGDISKAWSYEAYYQYGKTNYTQIFHNDVSVRKMNNSLDVVTDPRTGSPTFGQPVCRSALDGSDPSCVPYDIFGPNGASPGAIAYLATPGIIDGDTEEQIANINFTGQLGEMGVATPWAPDGFGVNLGAEYRKESLNRSPDAEFGSGDLAGQGSATLPISGNFRVLEVFAEGQFPIVEHSFIDELSFGAGYRFSAYTLSNGRTYNTTTYKLSAQFAPIRDIRFRGAYNRAVRAPNIQELFSPPFVGNDGTKDPCTDHIIQPTEYGCIASGLPAGRATPGSPGGQYNGKLGGNPNLLPEKATTLTAGVVLQPRMIPRLALTLDYFDIKIRDAIQGYGADVIISACIHDSTATHVSPACNMIHRDPSGSLWLLSATAPGVGFIQDTPTNVGKYDTNGIDANLTYFHQLGRLGRLSVNMNGTYTRHYKINNGLTEPFDCAGLYGPSCSGNTVGSSAPIPKWRHKLRTTLTMPNGLGLSFQWRYVGKVKAETLVNNETIGGGSGAFDPGLHIPGQSYFDLTATANVGNHFNVRVGVNNILDRLPPLVTSGNAGVDGSNLCPGLSCNGNTFPGTWDPLGRFVYAGVSVTF